MNSQRFKLCIASVLLLIAGILRFSALERQSLWDDESFTLRALGIIPEPMTMAEGAPPLYFLTLRGWIEIAGRSLASVRAYSALWGVAGVALMGIFASRVLSAEAGLFSAAALTFHPFHVAYSQEARPYAMVFALATITLWMAWEKKVWLFVLASTALLWTHPWGVFVWFASVALVLRSPLHKGGLQGSFQLLPCLLPLVLAAPALWHFTRLSLFESFWAKPPDLGFLASVVEALGGGTFYVGGWRFASGWSGTLLPMTFVLLWVVGFLSDDARRTRQNLWVALVGLLLVPALAGWLAPQASAHQRYWLTALPLTVLVAARGWDSLPSPFCLTVTVILLAGFSHSTVQYFTAWKRGNVLQATRWVDARRVPDTVLIIPQYMQPLWKYHDRSGLELVDEQGVDELAPVIRQHRQAILVTLDVPNAVQDALDARFSVLERSRFPAAFNLGLVATIYANRNARVASD